MRILAQQSIAVLVDVQERLYPHVSGARELGGRCACSSRAAGLSGSPSS